jgi:small subunit ribosomal protein S8
MAINDPVSDLLTRIRNGQQARHQTIRTPASRLRARVLDVLKAEGYIRGYREEKNERGLPELAIELKYVEGTPVIREITRVSKPGRRVYSNVKQLPRVRNGLGCYILSTPQGVMTDHDARTKNVGGEVLASVY